MRPCQPARCSVDKEESRIRHHLLPRIGSKRLDEVRPRDIRDLVRALRAGGELAPRTIHNVYGDAHAMFRDAAVEELIESSPCVLPRGELPPKVDKDPEWRGGGDVQPRGGGAVDQRSGDPRRSGE